MSVPECSIAARSTARICPALRMRIQIFVLPTGGGSSNPSFPADSVDNSMYFASTVS